jgi:hypothetical protein
MNLVRSRENTGCFERGVSRLWWGFASGWRERTPNVTAPNVTATRAFCSRDVRGVETNRQRLGAEHAVSAPCTEWI